MKVVWSRLALGDLDRIQAYLVTQSPRAAERIWVRIVERVSNQAAMPFAAPLEGNGPTRRLGVTRTPYLVLYRVVGDELRVEALFHTSQDR